MSGVSSQYQRLEQRLSRLVNARQQMLLRGGLVGLERETLRVTPDGSIAQTPHSARLGSALTHPWITTDFSEALLELITPPLPDARAALDFLRDVQVFVHGTLGEETLWATSMPCILAGEESIPIAQYGSSNAGRMKHVYRVGLGNRYGMPMQVIAGVHFNYSVNEALWPVYQALEQDSHPLTEFMSNAYFGMIRNLQRFGWLIPYLFGASPAVCKTFVGEGPTDMELFDETTYYYPYATSLRMGDIGYQNNKAYESGFKARYDNLDIYVASLTWAIETPSPRYQAIGVKVDGEYRQLNANILQIENEYYSTVRPKQILKGNEKPSLALRDRGVQYVELRSLDVSAYTPLGVEESQLRFLEAFMMLCLLLDSPRIGHKEAREIDRNEFHTAHRGRDPALVLRRNDQEISLRSWGLELLAGMEAVCDILDEGREGSPYRDSLEAQRQVLKDPDRTPSARMLAEMRERGEGFHQFASRISRGYRREFNALRLDDGQQRIFEDLAASSLIRQREIEQADDISFDEYLERYFAQS